MTQPPDEPIGTTPIDDLGDLWDALDALPRQSSSIDMAATTVEMVAAVAEPAARPPASPTRLWLMPLALVAASLLAGVVAGRIIAPDPDARILDQLPLVRHVDLLREAGSVAFLQALAARRHQLPARMPPEFMRREEQEFDATLRELEAEFPSEAAAADVLTARREAIEGMSPQDRDALERSLATFLGLSSVQRRDLAAVAAALADPRRQELRAAARLWHAIIAASDPADRKNIVDLDTTSRLEWLERRSRQRERNGERRGPPPPEGGAGPRGQRPPPGPDGRRPRP
ncbi:MAG: hypothetical protein ACKOC8_09895 [Pirellulales bacterium]